MIPVKEDRTYSIHGSQRQSYFNVRQEDLPQIFNILRSSLYSDKILAVLREYGANAWDANRENGKGDIPIEVILPNRLDPTLVIRDCGKGLSEEEVYAVYAMYGRSTKRESNLAIGHFGIGAKAGFAYNDTFVIQSKHGGKLIVYHALLDETGMGIIHKVYEENCPLEETGLEIAVPVHVTDIPDFHSKAISLFSWFKPQPKITEVTLENPYGSFTEEQLKSGRIVPGHDGWTCVMGIIPYKLDLRQLERYGIKIPYNYAGTLIFDLGELETTASRETLEYKPYVLEKLSARIHLLLDELTIEYRNLLDRTDLNDVEMWNNMRQLRRKYTYIPPEIEKRVNAILQSSRKLVLPSDEKTRSFDFLLVDYQGKTRSQDEVYYDLSATPKLIFIDIDNHVALRRYGESTSKIFIKKRSSCNWSTERSLEEIEKLMKEWRISGVTCTLLSSLSYAEEPVTQKRSYSANLLKAKRVMGSLRGYNAWEPFTLDDTYKDQEIPYVFLFRYKTVSEHEIPIRMKKLSLLATSTGNSVDLTLLCGLKQSGVSPEKLNKKGFNLVPFSEWYHKKVKECFDLFTFDQLDWLRMLKFSEFLDTFTPKHRVEKIEALSASLTPAHPLVKYLVRFSVLNPLKEYQDYMEIVEEFIDKSDEMNKLDEKYPLLHNDFNRSTYYKKRDYLALLSHNFDFALRYIQERDAYEQLRERYKHEQCVHTYAGQYFFGDSW